MGIYCHEISRAYWVRDCEFSLFSCVCVLWLALMESCYVHIYFQAHFKLYHYNLLYSVLDHIPYLSFVLSSISVPCFYLTPPLYRITWLPSCDQSLSLWICMTCAGQLYCIRDTNSIFCCFIFICQISWPLQFLVFLTCIWMYYLVWSFYIYGSSFCRYL